MDEELSNPIISPPPFDTGLHILSAEQQGVAVPRETYLEWTSQTSQENILEGTRFIAAVDRTEPVTGTYPEPGSIRRVILADDSSGLEVIHRSNEYAFAYQVWRFSAA